MTPTRAQTRTTRSGVERTNHEATGPPHLKDKTLVKNATSFLCHFWLRSLLSFITFYIILLDYMNLNSYFWKNMGRETKKTKKQYTEAKTKKT